MFTILVLIGCLASALALPPITSVEPIATPEVQTDALCALACTAMIMIPPVYLACLLSCDSKKGANFNATKPFNFSPEVVKPDFAVKAISSSYVKECLNKCTAVYKSSSNDYKYCVIGCNLGGQKLVEKEGVVPTGGRQARSYDSCYFGTCKYVIGFPPALGPCMLVCMATSRRRRSIDYPMDEITPLIDVDYKKVPVAPVVDSEATEDVKQCFERCTVAFGNSGVDFLRCIYRCSHEDPNFEIPVEKFVKPVVDGKREARDRNGDCALACSITGPFYAICAATVCG